MVKKAGKEVKIEKSSWDGAVDAAFNVVLTPEEQVALKALALEEVEAEQKKLASDEYKAQVKSALKKKMLYTDVDSGREGVDKVAIYLDLPLMAPDVRLDGRRYTPGKTYHVKPAVADVLFEVMERTFGHAAELKGEKKTNAYRRERAYGSLNSSHAG